MADKSEGDAPKKGSCLGKLVVLFVMLGLGGLGAAIYFIALPQDLTDLDGRGPAAVSKDSRDLVEVMRNAIDGGYSASITEEDVNLYLRDTLKAEQGGVLASQVSISDVAVRLEDGRAEVIIVRDVAGYPLTLSMYLRVEQTEQPNGRVTTQIFRDGGPYHESLPQPPVGGRYGRLPVPQGFLRLVLDSFVNLAGVYRTTEGGGPTKALDFVDEMARVRIEEGKLVLDPVAGGMDLPSMR